MPYGKSVFFSRFSSVLIKFHNSQATHIHSSSLLSLNGLVIKIANSSLDLFFHRAYLQFANRKLFDSSSKDVIDVIITSTVALVWKNSTFSWKLRWKNVTISSTYADIIKTNRAKIFKHNTTDILIVLPLNGRWSFLSFDNWRQFAIPPWQNLEASPKHSLSCTSYLY